MADMAQRIKERRLAMNYTQEELADKLGLQKSAIAKYENGRVENIKRSIISKMSEALDCNPAYLMGWDMDLSNTINKPTRHHRDATETAIISNMEGLNHAGKKKLYDYSDVLIGNPAYAKDTEPILNAAHERTDIEVTNEMKKHDDDIMMDPEEWK